MKKKDILDNSWRLKPSTFASCSILKEKQDRKMTLDGKKQAMCTYMSTPS